MLFGYGKDDSYIRIISSLFTSSFFTLSVAVIIFLTYFLFSMVRNSLFLSTKIHLSTMDEVQCPVDLENDMKNTTKS